MYMWLQIALISIDVINTMTKTNLESKKEFVSA